MAATKLNGKFGSELAAGVALRGESEVSYTFDPGSIPGGNTHRKLYNRRKL